MNTLAKIRYRCAACSKRYSAAGPLAPSEAVCPRCNGALDSVQPKPAVPMKRTLLAIGACGLIVFAHACICVFLNVFGVITVAPMMIAMGAAWKWIRQGSARPKASVR